MGQVFILGLTERFMKVNGPRALRMAKAFGKVSMVTRTSANGDNQKLLAMVYINGKMAIGMKVSGRIVLNMDKAPIFSLMATVTQEYMSWVNPKGKASTSGKTAAYILESSKMV